jgi:predicted GNAT family N-acyltransferase
MKSNDEHKVKMCRLIKIQRFMKKVYKVIQEKRAVELQAKLLKAIVAFKTEKRKDFEIEAAEVIEKTYRKFCFRDQLN